MNSTRTLSALVLGISFLLSASIADPVFATPINLAPSGTASASSVHPSGSYPVSKANDGNRVSDQFFHSFTGAGGDWWEVDLGSNYYLDRVEIFPRNLLQRSVENFRLEVFNSDDLNVFSDVYHPTDSTRDKPWGTSEVRNVYGSRVRISRVDDDPDSLTFAEFEVWGQDTPVGANIAFLGTASAKNWRLNDAWPIDAIDGDINGYWGQADTTGIGKTGSLYHSENNEAGNWWQVDLGSVRNLDYVNIFSRVDTTGGASNVTLDVLADDGTTVVSSQNIQMIGTDLNGQRYDQTFDLSGTAGRFVRLTSNSNLALAFGEVEVFEVVPEPSSLLLLVLGTAALCGFARRRRG